MSEPQPGPEIPDSGEWTTPEPEQTQPFPAGAGDAGGWPPPPPPPPGGTSPSAPGGYPWAGYPGSGYPGGGYQGYPGGGYPGYPGGGYPGYPGGGYPGGGYPGYPGGPGRRAGRGAAALITAVAIVAAALGAGIAYAAKSSPAGSSNASSGPPGGFGSQPGSANPGNQGPFGSGGQQQPGSNVPGAGAPSDVASIAAKVDPALVDVNVTFGYDNVGGQTVGGAGTGIVLTSDGEVLTNNHVIDGATSVSVTDLGNGQTYGASVVGYDNPQDMAVLQLKGASGLHTATISKSAPTVGEPVVAIGNVGGKGGTPTASGGSITGLNQSINATDSLDNSVERLSGLIETNADVQEGDSGGSLVNSAGQVVGMDTAASSSYSIQSQSVTEGFAIPITLATATAREIQNGDGSSVVHVGATAFLGVQVESAAQNSGGFPGQGGSSGSGGSGALIENLISGGAAQQAGLQEGDVITSLAGQSVGSPTDLTNILIRYHPGDSIPIGWTDQEGQSHTATIDLGSGPPA